MALVKPASCLGCGTIYAEGADCEVCYARLARCLDVFGHWPMECSVSAAALHHIESAIREYLDNDRTKGVDPVEVETELTTVANQIRAYLQHVAAGLNAFKPDITDEELLS